MKEFFCIDCNFESTIIMNHVFLSHNLYINVDRALNAQGYSYKYKFNRCLHFFDRDSGYDGCQLPSNWMIA